MIYACYISQCGIFNKETEKFGVFAVLYPCTISFSAYGNKAEFEAFVMLEFEIENELLLVTDPFFLTRKMAFIFLDTYFLIPFARIRYRLI